MADWLSTMDQTFEYYTVDPGTWKDVKRLTNVEGCSITRDLNTETLGYATIDVTESVGECYIRVYLVTVQNGLKERFPLGTYLVQTPSSSFNGKIRKVSMDAYSPLLELKESQPPIGYSLFKDSTENNIMENVYLLTNEHVRAPVVPPSNDTKLTYDFVASPDDTWLTFVSDLMAIAKYSFDLDEMGRILFLPKQDTASLQPVWTYNDDNSSILLPDITMNHDLFGIPNTVEVVYSNGVDNFYAKAVNDDPNSPISTVNRGRAITYRDTEPNLSGTPTEDQIKEYATRLLRELSSVEYSVSYSHGYCPVRVGDCVRLNYSRAGLNGIKAKVISQTIDCESGCTVTETAVFTTKLWG